MNQKDEEKIIKEYGRASKEILDIINQKESEKKKEK